MKAFIKTSYGGPEVLRLEEVEKPAITEGFIRIKVMANSVNPVDWHIIRGEPFLARLAFGLFRPKYKIAGADFSGLIEAVAPDVHNFKVGDRVFGENLKGGAFAEYVCAPANACALMPPNADFPEMAAAPIAGITALQAFVTHGKLQKGESVLINGASGGVGHFAVQIAKALGANVTGVCSSKKVDFVKSLGADQVIAYDQHDVHEHATQYDLVFDVHGNLSHQDFTRMGRRGVLVGFTTMGNTVSVLLKNALSKFPLKQFTADANTTDLETLAAFIEAKKVRVHLDKTYPYTEIPEAIRYIEAMHTTGKVAMVWEGREG